MSKICTQFATSGFCVLGPSCQNAHPVANSKAPLEVTAFDFYTLWECKPDAWTSYQESKGLDKIIVLTKKSGASDTQGKESNKNNANQLIEDYSMDDFGSSASLHDTQMNTVTSKKEISKSPHQSLDEDREQMRKKFEDRKRKRDIDFLEQQRKEEEDLERIRIARQKIKQQMQEKHAEEQNVAKLNAEKEKNEQNQSNRQEMDLNLILEMNPVDVKGSNPEYDRALAIKWNGKINFGMPRIPLMAPLRSPGSVTYKSRQQILEIFIAQFLQRFGRKKAIVYAFETEERLYKTYADKKSTYWMTGIQIAREMSGGKLDIEELQNTSTSSQANNMNAVKKVKELDTTSKNRMKEKHITTANKKYSKEKPTVEKRKYCICGRDETYDSDMIQCENENCAREWFHFKCMNLKEAPQGAWFCPEHQPSDSNQK